MEYSEIFLIVWGSLATAFAIYFHHIAKTLYGQRKLLMLSLEFVAKGEAKAFIKGDKVHIEGVQDGINS